MKCSKGENTCFIKHGSSTANSELCSQCDENGLEITCLQTTNLLKKKMDIWLRVTVPEDGRRFLQREANHSVLWTQQLIWQTEQWDLHVKIYTSVLDHTHIFNVGKANVKNLSLNNTYTCYFLILLRCKKKSYISTGINI